MTKWMLSKELARIRRRRIVAFNRSRSNQPKFRKHGRPRGR